MRNPITSASKGKICFVSEVSQFPSENNEYLFLKHKNKLFKISAKSSLVNQSKIFKILQKPRRLREILKLLSDFNEKQVIVILQNLFRLGLLVIEPENASNTAIGKDLNQHHFYKFNTNHTNHNSQDNSGLILIGDGILIERLMSLLRAMKIQFCRRHPNEILDVFTEERQRTSGTVPRKSKAKKLELTTLLQSIDKSDLIVVAEDYHNINLFESINKICFKKNKPWFRISVDDNIGYIGPFVIPTKTSCFNCCELRLVTNSPYYEYELWRNKRNIPKTRFSLPIYFVDNLIASCVSELLRFLILHREPETFDNLFITDKERISVTKHRITQHPNCIYCNPPLNKEQLESKLKTIGSSKKSTRQFLKHSLSSDSLSEKKLLIKLRELIDSKTGIIQEYERLYVPSPLGIYFHHYSTATCSRPLRIGPTGKLTHPVRVEDNLITPSPSGSGETESQAELHALMESVERYSNMIVEESRLVWSPYKDIETKAINPMDLGLYSEEQYGRKDFGCSRFSADSQIPWIKGYDLYSGKSVLVPADFVYYPPIRQKPLVFDTSNGASSHTDIIQAILNGLYELIERDSFLTMWLNKIPMPILDIKELPFDFRESIRQIKKFGMSVKLVDITGDTKIPAIAAVCHNDDPTKYPAVLVGGGSHADATVAIRKALFEMEFMLSEMLERPNKKKVSKPHQITSMYQHPLYYLNPRMRKYWEFMISGKKTRKLPNTRISLSNDNHVQLRQIVNSLQNNNNTVVFVDLTPPDLGRMGLKTVKVFVKGFQPLYVGTELRTNLQRLNSTAKRLGRKFKVNRTVSDLNLAPHPLP